MADSPASYIHLVQHLIERCLLFNMTEEECVAALSKHANINPVITSTVWKELEKENREFFEAYDRQRGDLIFEMETQQVLLKLVSDAQDQSSSGSLS
ncbi:hypothetical protein QJS10_CPB14g01450 [Acorus calamus]|uniref:Angiotensin-converting enzyme 2 n=1 Tax=Acorus calamus TaxID=4465 RepID=A0AAV9DCZ3_ACOCL|nr:hypothetical protein QJS10_CPB14g01450 [Acorus calamus]